MALIVCLHGFLGRPDDWNVLRRAGFAIDALDYTRDALDPQNGKALTTSGSPALIPPATSHQPPATQSHIPCPLSSLPKGDILLGYSLGGRIALQALIAAAESADPSTNGEELAYPNACQSASSFRAAVIISAGLNLEDPAERTARRERDDALARSFESEPWDVLIPNWNAQPVFGRFALRRREEDYDRAVLAATLRNWSPGVLPPLAPHLHRIAIPVLWIAGERDAQYIEVGRRAAQLLPNAELWICPNAGHRVPWEERRALIQKLREWIASVSP